MNETDHSSISHRFPFLLKFCSNPLTLEDAIIPEDQMAIFDQQPNKNLLRSVEVPPDAGAVVSSSSSSSSGTQLESTQIDSTQVDGTQLESTQLDGDVNIDSSQTQTGTQLEHTQLDQPAEVYGQQQTTGKFAMEFIEEEEEENEHNDACSACGEGGNVILCDFCPRVYHKDCAGLRRVPRGEWKCPACTEEITQVEHTEVDIPMGSSSFTGSGKKPTTAAAVTKTKLQRSHTPRPRGVLELENWDYPRPLLNKKIRKRFNNESNIGEIVSYDEENQLYLIQYDDGDKEEMDEEGVKLYLLHHEAMRGTSQVRTDLIRENLIVYSQVIFYLSSLSIS